MKVRTLIICASVLALGTSIAILPFQARRLAALRDTERQLLAQTSEAPDPGSAPTQAEPIAAGSTSHSPSPELLRLRGQIGQLERRKRELAGVPAENKSLRTQLATKGTNAPGTFVLPADYIKKSTARFSGYGAPEDTIQSLLWAVQTQNTAQLLEAFNPEAAKKLEAEIQRRGSPEEFFNDANALPGLRIIGKQTQADGIAVLKVEMLPGTENEARELRFKQFDGQWKLISGF